MILLLTAVPLLIINRFVHIDADQTPALHATLAHDDVQLAHAVRADCRQRHPPACARAHARINSSGGLDECAVIGDTLQCVQCVSVLSTVIS
jgi:hypothetical protein